MEMLPKSLDSHETDLAHNYSSVLIHLLRDAGPQKCLLDCHNASSNFNAIFNNYIKLYSEPLVRNLIGIELATLIFTGCVNLDEQGNLQEIKEEAPEFTPETVQFRAIAAYEYLVGNDSDSAKALRHKLKKALTGETSVIQGQHLSWEPCAVKQFASYYQKRNPELLKEKAFVNSSVWIISSYSPRINLNIPDKINNQTKPDQEIKDTTKPGCDSDQTAEGQRSNI